MTQTTTFVQVINDQRYKVEIPMHRVESVINRVDMWIDRNKPTKAFEAIKPFLVVEAAAPITLVTKKKKLSDKSNNKPDIQGTIEQNRSKGKYAVMSILENELGLTKPQVYYYVRKAGL